MNDVIVRIYTKHFKVVFGQTIKFSKCTKLNKMNFVNNDIIVWSDKRIKNDGCLTNLMCLLNKTNMPTLCLAKLTCLIKITNTKRYLFETTTLFGNVKDEIHVHFSNITTTKKFRNTCLHTQHKPTQHLATLQKFTTVLVFHSTFKIFGARVHHIMPAKYVSTPLSNLF